MNALEKALNVKFQTTSALTSVFTGNAYTSGTNTSGLHWDLAPKNAAPPYLVAQVLNAPLTSVYGGASFYDAAVQFKSFAVGRRTALANLETFCAAFDEVTLTLDSGVMVHMLRTSEPMAMRLPAEEQTGGDEYQAVVNYSFSVDS